MSDEKKTQEQIDKESQESIAERYRRIQTEKALVAKFMGVSIDKVVKARSGGWTTR